MFIINSKKSIIIIQAKFMLLQLKYRDLCNSTCNVGDVDVWTNACSLSSIAKACSLLNASRLSIRATTRSKQFRSSGTAVDCPSANNLFRTPSSGSRQSEPTPLSLSVSVHTSRVSGGVVDLNDHWNNFECKL